MNRFNHTRFNLKAAGEEIVYSEDFSVSISAVCALSEALFYAADGAAMVGASALAMAALTHAQDLPVAFSQSAALPDIDLYINEMWAADVAARIAPGLYAAVYMDGTAVFQTVPAGGYRIALEDTQGPAQFEAKAQVAPMFPQETEVLPSQMAGAAGMRINLHEKTDFRDNMAMAAGAALNVYPAIDAPQRFAARAACGLNTAQRPMACDIAFGGFAKTGENFPLQPLRLETVFWSQVTTIHFNITYADFDVTIPPGSTLVIDSNGYAVLLDGENVIWSHTGGWLRMNRNTFDVTFEPVGGSGSLSKQVLYTERWL